MLEIDVTKQSDSIENLFAKQFAELTQYPMDNNTSEMYIKLLMLKDEDLNIEQKDKSFLYSLIEKRYLVTYSYKLDIRTTLFLSFFCQTAGIVVMYLWYLQYECKTRNINEITFETFSVIFGNGFPSVEALHKLWVNQKVDSNGLGSDNLLDYTDAGKSLFNYQNMHTLEDLTIKMIYVLLGLVAIAFFVSTRDDDDEYYEQ